MWNGYFGEFVADDAIAEFLIETDGGDAGVHKKALVSEVAGDVLGKDREGASDAFALHAAGDGHLAETDSGGIDAGEEAAAQQAVVFEGAHEDVVLFLVELIFGEMKSQWFAQHFIAQMDHLLIFFCSVIYHPKRHAVGIVFADRFGGTGRWAGRPENTEKIP